jgi:signal transduction histidine kinase
VRLKFLSDALELEVEDHGKGLVAKTNGRGIGLVAMRERAEIIGGTLELLQPASGGTIVRLRIERQRVETHGS